ncbi:MAG TPA: flagellin [Candidatus Binatia bacterium]|nr:flagellin [Candidatus Binatia bacterium]
MPISLNGALHAHTAQAGRALERLASGKRLDAAADDAAGLAIADQLSRDRAVTGQALRNASDGVSVVRIAEGAVSQVGKLTGRIAELATQAASGTVGDAQRATIQAEVTQLTAEIDRIAVTTTFNGQALFGGEGLSAQVALDGDPSDAIALPNGALSAAALGLDTVDVSTQAGAQAAFAALDTAGEAITAHQATLGATGAQLASAIDQLRVSGEQLAASESRIRDADVAAEAAELAAGRIREQLGVATAAQANVSAGAALQLLA